VRAISAALQPVVLRNEITLQDVTNTLTSKTWDIVWFAAHGNHSGIQLSNKTLTTSTMIQLVKASGAKLVVINTCDSEQIGAWLHMQTGASVICTIAPVGDAEAYVTGVLLSKALAQGLSYEDAYNRSKPGEVAQAQVYRMFSKSHTPDDNAKQWMGLLTLALQPVYERLDTIEGKVDELGAQAVTYNNRQLWAWALGFFLFCVAIVMLTPTMRAMLGFHHAAANAVVICLWAFSGLCFTYGMGMVRL
jgi:hypothetical protein